MYRIEYNSFFIIVIYLGIIKEKLYSFYLVSEDTITKETIKENCTQLYVTQNRLSSTLTLSILNSRSGLRILLIVKTEVKWLGETWVLKVEMLFVKVE